MEKSKGSILSVLKSSRLRVRLVQFACSKLCDEVPKFWIAVFEYEKHQTIEKAKEIFRTFLEKGSEQEVALSSRERQKVEAELRSEQLPSFAALKQEAEMLMQNNLFQEFHDSVLSIQKSWSSGASLSDSASGTESESRKQTHEMLISMLLDRKHHAVLRALLRASGEAPELIASVTELLLLDGDDPLVDFFDYLCMYEVAKTADPNTLFREQSVSVLVFGEVARRKPMRSWAASVLRKGVLRAAAGGALRVAQEVWRALEKRAAQVPPVLARVLLRASESAALRFPAVRQRVVGALVLLRMLCPHLVAPVPLVLSEPPRAPVMTALAAAARLLLAKASFSPADPKDFEGEELAFLKAEPTCEALMQRLLTAGSEEGGPPSKAQRVLGGRSRSASVVEMPVPVPSPPRAEVAARARSGSVVVLSSPSRETQLQQLQQMLVERDGESSRHMLQVRSRSGSMVASAPEISTAVRSRGSAAPSPASSPRERAARRGSFSAGLSTIRALFASPAGSPRDAAAPVSVEERLGRADEREDAVVGLRQVIVNALLLNWADVKASLAEEQLAETTFQWFEKVLKSLEC